MKEIEILGRTIRWNGDELVSKADKKHAETIIKEMGLEMTSKGLSSPCEREDKEEEEKDQEGVTAEEERRFRKVAATGNYLGLDRPDIQYSVNES